MKDVEKLIRQIVGIPDGWKIYSIVKDRVGRREYYRVLAYKSGEGVKGFRVKRKDEEDVLRLWEEFKRLREKKQELLRRLEEEPEFLLSLTQNS